MSKELPQPQQSEEVDLGQLFKLIGNAFDRFFRFIGNLLNKLFLAFVWFIFFIKKHIIKIAIAGIVGFGYGFYKQKSGAQVYKSTTVIKQNYETGDNLYRLIDYYNDLIAEEDSITLGNFLEIDSKKASTILNLEVESVIDMNSKLEDYDQYLKKIDTSLASILKFEDYVKNSKKESYPFQKIIIKAEKNDVFSPVIGQITKKISNTEYFKNEQKKDIKELEDLEKSLINSLEASENLQDVYKTVLEKSTENTGSQTSISIDNTENKSITKEFELYESDVKLRRELVKIQREKEDKQKIIEIISSQESQGTIDNTKTFFGNDMDSKIFFSIVLMILTLIILMSFHFIKFLEKYRHTN